MTAERISILLVDDHALFREEVRRLLEPHVDVVAEAPDGEDAILRHRLHRPRITLMDLQMPRLGGIDAIARIRSEAPDARFVVLTSSSSEQHVHGAIAAGAQAYLLKQNARSHLLQVIHAVDAGGRWFDAAIVGSLPTKKDGRARSKSRLLSRLFGR